MRLLKVLATALCAVSLVSCGQKSGEAGETASEQPAAETVSDAPAVIVLAKDASIASDADKLTVIDFNATWCGPCRQFAPTFDKVAEQYRGSALFYSVDVDDHQDIAAQYNVTSIPMVVYIKPDGSYTSTVGLLSEAEFAAAVEAALK